MKIVVCGSMLFSKEMVDAKRRLEARGHQVVIPEGAEAYAQSSRQAITGDKAGDAQKKADQDLIRKHYREIAGGDAVLILNKDKNGIRNYIGGNSFLEMGFAYVLEKKIYVLNPLPEEQTIFYQELLAMRPTVLAGDLARIEEAHGA